MSAFSRGAVDSVSLIGIQGLTRATASSLVTMIVWPKLPGVLIVDLGIRVHRAQKLLEGRRLNRQLEAATKS